MKLRVGYEVNNFFPPSPGSGVSYFPSADTSIVLSDISSTYYCATVPVVDPLTRRCCRCRRRRFPQTHFFRRRLCCCRQVLGLTFHHQRLRRCRQSIRPVVKLPPPLSLSPICWTRYISSTNACFFIEAHGIIFLHQHRLCCKYLGPVFTPPLSPSSSPIHRIWRLFLALQLRLYCCF